MYFAFKNFLFAVPLLLAGAVLLFYIGSKLKKDRLSRLMDLQLAPLHLDPVSSKLRSFRTILFLAAMVFLLLAMARPQWGSRVDNMPRKGVDIIIAVDTSFSMMTEDQKPNRLEKAKHEIAAFIDSLKGDRIGIISFAGSSFLQCPLTIDYDAAKMYLDIIDVNSAPLPGTAIAKAVRNAIKSFDQEDREHKVLILITDGEDHDSDPVAAAREAAKNGIVIYTIGIGSTTGEPIPVRDENGTLLGYKKDRKGNVVMSRLNEPDLQRIAHAAGGRYFYATTGELELQRIYDEVQRMGKKDITSSMISRYEDRFEWFLVLGFLLLLLEMLIPERKLDLSAVRLWRKKQ
jgi:Ca-activated chloride channel homolog